MWNRDDEAKKLHERFLHVPNKAEWARAHGLPGGPSMLSQHIHGHRPINMEAAVVYAAGFGVSLAEISPRLAEQKAREDAALGQQARRARPSVAEPAAGYTSAPTSIQAALLMIDQAMRAADPASRPEIRLTMMAFLEGLQPEKQLQRLCALLDAANSNSPARSRRAA